MKILHKRLRMILAGLIGLTGCASIGPPLPPSLELPKPPTDLRAARKGDQVKLTWTIPALTTDRESLRYLGKTRVCRSLAATVKQCETPVGEAAPPADFASARKSTSKKVSASFTDTLSSAIEQDHATGFATYAVEVLNTAGRGAGISNRVHVALVPTLSPFSGFSAKTTGQGVLLSWKCPAAEGRGDTKYLFRIYRRAEAGETRIAQVDATSCAAGSGNEKARSFLDESIEWEKTYFYRAAVVSVVEVAGKPAVEVEGEDTEEVKVFAHDIFPPGVPTGLQAVFSGEGQQAFIDLVWAPVTDADLEGYNVYRHEDGAAAVKLNSEAVKTPGFRDMHVVAGKVYFYAVSAVDQRGNESARSEEASEKVP
ncbi:MAG: fibronectin type III domain-containing protein [Candidatus Sulfotelmatobacter sp.]